MTEVFQLDYIEDSVLMDLEDMAFRLGVNAGLVTELNLSESFLTLIQEFIEFVIPEIQYSALAFIDSEKKFIQILSPYSDFNNYEQFVNSIEKTEFIDENDQLEVLLFKKFDFGELPSDLSEIRNIIPIEVKFQTDFLGYLYIATPSDYSFIWNTRKVESLLLRLCQMIYKVARLIHYSEKNTFSIINQIETGIIILSYDKQLKFINNSAKYILGLEGDIQDHLKTFLINIFYGLTKELDGEQIKHSTEMSFKYPVERVLKIDITDLKEKEQYLVVFRDISQYIEIDRIKTEIISTVSHELRTPLTAIHSMIRNMIRGIAGDLNDKMKQYLERMITNTTRLSNLINNLLDLSKLEAGEVFLRRDYTSIKDLVVHVVDSLQDKFESKHIVFKTKFSKKVDKIFVDAPKIDQVLINLIGNAVKFVKEKGKIGVRVQLKSDFVYIHVLDNGVGIPDNEKQNIFKKFKQVGRVYGAGEKGTGLGLSISLEIIKLHGGQIELFSPPKENFLSKRGTEFLIKLPYLKDGEALYQTVHDRMNEFSKKDQPLTLVELNFNHVNMKNLLKKKNLSLNDIKMKLKMIIKRGVDDVFVMKDLRLIYVILMGASEAFINVQKRIEDEWLKISEQESQKKNKIEISMKHKTYPYDFNTIQTLIDFFLKKDKNMNGK